MAGNVIEMPRRPVDTAKRNTSPNQNKPLLEQMTKVAATGNKSKIIDLLEELSERYKNKTKFDVSEIEDIVETYSYFCSCLDRVTLLERMEKWGTGECFFLNIADDITTAAYQKVAEQIQSTLGDEQKGKVKDTVNKILKYLDKDTTITLSFFNEGVPSFQVVVTEKEFNEQMKDELITGFIYQFITTGMIKGTIVKGDTCKIFGIYIMKDIIEMSKDDIIEEFYTSEDGIHFKLETNAEIIQIVE